MDCGKAALIAKGGYKPGTKIPRVAALRVGTTKKHFVMQGVNVMTEFVQQSCKREWKVLIQLDLHRICGTAGTGKSSSAEAAANAMAA